MKNLFLVFTAACMLAGCTKSSDTPKTNAVPAGSPQNTTTATNKTSNGNSGAADALESVYTDLSFEKCKKLDPKGDPGAIMKAECPGAGGYKVILYASEHSEALTLVDQAGKSTDVGIHYIVDSAAGFMLGDKIEWRLGDKSVPNAFIVRANKFIDPDDLQKQESSLLVGKLNGDGPCITDVVRPSTADQNTRARELADNAKDRPCIKGK